MSDRTGLLRLLAIGMCIVASGLVIAQSRDGRPQQGDSALGKAELRLSLTKPVTRPLDVGEKVELPVSVAFRDLPPRSRVYAHLLTLDGDAWITPGGGRFTVTNPTLSLSGQFVDGDRSVFKIAPSNYPVSMLIKRDTLAMMFDKLLGGGKDVKDLADGIVGNQEEGYRLFLAFLTSVGDRREGIEHTTVSFTVPDYPYYYDRVLIAPFVLTFDADGSQTAHYAGANATTVTVGIRPNRPVPAREAEIKGKTSDIPGKATITGFSPSNAVLATGARNTLNLRIDYQQLKPGTAIYVAPIAFSGERYVFGALTTTIGSYAASGKPDFIDNQSNLWRIPKEGRPLRVPFFGGQDLEAAFVTTVAKGGDGEATGQITFVPPAYARRYERVHLVPILVVPTDEGLRFLIDDGRLKGPRLLVSEG